MDFGFVRGPKNKSEPTGKILASFDGYTSYLLITDEASRYNWVFPTKDKKPTLLIVSTFLEHHGLKQGMRRVRTDQGGNSQRAQNSAKCAENTITL